LRLRARRQKRVRGGRASPGQGFRSQALEGANPKGAASGGRPKPASVARDARKGQSPEAAASRSGLLLASGNNGWRNGTWVLPDGNVPDTLQAEEAPKGQNPTGAAGTKQGRHGLGGRKPPRGQPNPAGGTQRVWHGLRTVDLRSLMCQREEKPMRGADRLSGFGRHAVGQTSLGKTPAEGETRERFRSGC
jgi:hypothetical protein